MAQGIGIGLSQRFYEKIVAPILHENFPHLSYAAARIGLGSEILGFDSEISADHDYGPCVQLFLPATGFSTIAPDIMKRLDAGLPPSFEGWPVRYSTNVRPPAENPGSGMLGADHGAELYTVAAWCDRFWGRQFPDELTVQDWLSYSEQTFLTVTAGAVFRDDFGELTSLRRRLAYFPRDVWLYKLAAQWGRIAEERAYVGRTGDAGDDIGSRVIAGRMVGNIMRLAMLIERRYAPYPKWFGTAFSELDCASDLKPLLDRVMRAENWKGRENGLIEACRFVAELQITNGIPGAIAPKMGAINARPYQFVDSLAIFSALRSKIKDETLRQLPEFGAADQFLTSNFLLAVPAYSSAATASLFELAEDIGG
ncbi:DUF4037 domain-containing protein [Agrobacterium sp. V1]|uniref:DUF4037 domain-containing protein n=1 Tax=Agrobacterium sp. V1 TaxID=3061957 RepID=UPI002671DC04|nr:DUF4037 domain-containing protein [Agrobacterium sp. V1]MDO3444966.1 DUF4037 domain-containing protein [Agrobacterium sp. V1]